MFLVLNFAMVTFDFENDKRLIKKIEIERRTEKEMEVPKIKKSNKEVK